MINSAFSNRIDFDKDWFSELLRFAALNEPSDIANMKGEKYLIDWIQNNKQLGSSQNKILIIGGGTCEREGQLLSRLLKPSEISEIIAVDKVKPTDLHESFLDSNQVIANKIHWLEEQFDIELSKLEIVSDVDILICLGSSRYIHEIELILRNVLSKSKKKAILIAEFLEISELKRKSLSIWQNYFKVCWKKNPDDILISIRDLANISKVISTSLEGESITIESLDAPFIKKGYQQCQAILFDSFFPFWCKPMASQEEIMSMIIWNLLVVSGDFCEKRLLNFINSIDYFRYKVISSKDLGGNEQYIAVITKGN